MTAKYDPDLSTYLQAMLGNNAEYWFKAMNSKIDNIIKWRMWEVIKISDIGKKILIRQIILTQ
eukprot:12257483-Ditylum_brightwellii.AAC.1